MRVFTYSEARQNLAELLDTARKEEVIIRRKGGDDFTVTPREAMKSPFDIPSIKTQASTRDILRAVRESRESSARGIPKRKRRT